MKTLDYSYFFTSEDKIRICFTQNRGEIEYFIVQYSALIKGRWRSIMRIDTCHGYAHKHTFHLKDKEYIVTLTRLGDGLNGVFTESEKYVKTNFLEIKNNFLRT